MGYESATMADRGRFHGSGWRERPSTAYGGVMGGAMRWVVLLLAVGCAGGSSDVGDTDEADTDTDSDTDADTVDVPAFTLSGPYTLGSGELMPEDAAEYPTFADWVWSVDASDFPEYTTCMGEVIGVKQAIIFDADGALSRRYDLTAMDCSGDGSDAYHTITTSYGTWVFDSSADPEAGDLYTINGTRTWRIYPINAYFKAREGSVTFTLAPE
jgi:hypothetical protein